MRCYYITLPHGHMTFLEAIALELRGSLGLEVRLFALAQPQQGTAFGVAVPEIEAVVESPSATELKLQKAMIRSCHSAF